MQNIKKKLKEKIDGLKARWKNTEFRMIFYQNATLFVLCLYLILLIVSFNIEIIFPNVFMDPVEITPTPLIKKVFLLSITIPFFIVGIISYVLFYRKAKKIEGDSIGTRTEI